MVLFCNLFFVKLAASDPERQRMLEIQKYVLKTMQEPHPAVTDMYVLPKVSLLLKASQDLLLAYSVYYSCTKSF
jgi:hypothetical protein